MENLDVIPISYKLKKINACFEKHGLVDGFYKICQKENALSILATVLGWSWEDEFEDQCKELGFDVNDQVGLGKPYDSIINGKKVQCKTTTTCEDRKDIRSKIKDNGRRYHLKDFDILALRVCNSSGDRKYFIPSNQLVGENNLIKPSMKLSDHEKFLNNWDVFTKTTPKKDLENN